ncbi:MAG: SH3 domain-containing protein [Anaerolineales bacterium]|jgi:hypothetical protein
MKLRYLSLIVLTLFLFSAIIALIFGAIPLAAASSPTIASLVSGNPILPSRAQTGKVLPQAGSSTLIGCPVVSHTGIFADPLANGQPRDWLTQGTCVEFDQRSVDGRWIHIWSADNLVSHPGWVAAADILLEQPVGQLPATINTAGSGTGEAPASSAVIAGDSTSAPSGGGLSACLESVGSLNVRSGPGIAYRSVGYLLKGSCVPLTARTASAAWVKSEKGWMAAYYLHVEGDLSQLPVP